MTDSDCDACRRTAAHQRTCGSAGNGTHRSARRIACAAIGLDVSSTRCFLFRTSAAHRPRGSMFIKNRGVVRVSTMGLRIWLLLFMHAGWPPGLTIQSGNDEGRRRDRSRGVLRCCPPPSVRSRAGPEGTSACIDYQAWGRKWKGHRRRCVRGRGSAPVKATLARRHGRRRSGERRHDDSRRGPHSNPAFYSAGAAGAQTLAEVYTRLTQPVKPSARELTAERAETATSRADG